MNNRNETSIKLLPKSQFQDLDKDELPEEVSSYTKFYNMGLALVTAMLLAFVVLPRIPLLQKGDIVTKDISAPYTLYIEYQTPEQTIIAYKVNKGDVIVEAGRRVSEKSARILAEIARREGIGTKSHAFLGLTTLILILFFLFYQHIKRYRPQIITDTRKLFLLAFLLLVTVIVSQFTKYVFSLIGDPLGVDASTVGFALPVAGGAMLVTLLFDLHLALGFSFIISILLGVLFRGDPFMPIYYFVGSTVAALCVIQCKKRTAVLRAGALTGLFNLIAIASIDLYKGEWMSHGLYDLGAGLFGAFMVSMLVSLLLPFYEAMFDIATDIKLLELMDPNQPLLKELVYKSPGTYHHSILIGNLAEAAAEAIGENPLLARVGAYYHDIGKIRKPEYFIENQRPSENKHDRLTPSMSSLIIASHVKDGVEVAREHKLPGTVIDIIQQHHGTSLITYFYQKAKDLYPFTKISEEDYRYPGPRPRTKVAAIVMLADAVEAASRTLEDPTPQRIQALTNSVITRIFLDDQFSKCDLTLRNLREIAKSFNLILNGIFHHRIHYPGMDLAGEKKRSDYLDKKQPEEAKTGNGKDKGKSQDAVTEPRSS
ncbi:MAG: HDIG domain-containing metalloprotein [Nitrospirota bacterium]